MKKNIFKIVMMILGIGILDYGIAFEVDGTGRFTIILFGTLFSIIACVTSFENKKTYEFRRGYEK